MPITTLSDGTALLSIIPITAFYSPYIAANSAYLPFANVASGSSILPFSTLVATGPGAQAPFSTQASNVIQYGIDAAMIDFI